MEMGQGITTSYAMLVAEELGLDPGSLEVVHAPLFPEFGTQVTEDSASIRANWLAVRQVGATARHQFIQAAAAKWKVDAGSCKTLDGNVVHEPTGRKFRYTALADAAGRLPPPGIVSLAPETGFTVIGSERRRHEGRAIAEGALTYAADISVPGMMHASLLYPPRYGWRVSRMDDGEALNVPGVTASIDLGDCVAVVGRNTWAAEQGRAKVIIQWSGLNGPAVDSVTIRQLLEQAARSPGIVALRRNSGTVTQSARSFSAEYYLPFDAHAAIEPTSCVADARGHSVEVWTPTQSPWTTYRIAAQHGLTRRHQWLERISRNFSGRASDRVRIHAMPVGGGFGRRLDQDFVRHSVAVSRMIGSPVKMLLNREEDFRADVLRPASLHHMEASVDLDGRLASWLHRIAGCGPVGLGGTFPYDCAKALIEVAQVDTVIPTGSWRSTGHTPCAFAREGFLDEIAGTLGVDPVEYRLGMLNSEPRSARVLELAAERAGWHMRGSRLLGCAIHPSKDSHVAQIAEIVPDERGGYRVLRIVCAADCGRVINPAGIRAQIEGGILFALSAALHGGVRIVDGGLVERTFSQYKLLSIAEAPNIEVHLIDSAAPPGGAGEISLPPVAPAVANACWAATGMRSRSLPLSRLAA